MEVCAGFFCVAVGLFLFAALGHDKQLYLLVHVGMAVGFLAVLAVLRSKKLFDARRFPPMILESGIYALTLGTLIMFVMHRILGIDPKLSMGIGTSIVLSIGAGVYEELSSASAASPGGRRWRGCSGCPTGWR